MRSFRNISRSEISAAALSLALALGACGKKDQAPAQPAAAAALPAELQATFDRTCKTCHANPQVAGAPQVGDRAAWAPRVQQGREALLNHTIAGHNAMPPMGLCMDCSEEQFAALIEYMSGASLK